MKKISNTFFAGLLASCLLLAASCGETSQSTENTGTEAKGDQPSVQVNKEPGGPAEGEFDETTGMITITGDNVNVRAQASASSKVLFQVNKGEKLGQTGESSFVETQGTHTDFWYKVDKGGKEGWVFGAFTDQKLTDRSRTDRLRFDYAEFGDYYHLGFSWPDESTAQGHGWVCERYGMVADGSWDFGYGSQHCNLSGYELDLGEGSTNPKYEGKVFEVEWKSKMSTPWEGEGSMETVEMEIPIIVGLKLVEN